MNKKHKSAPYRRKREGKTNYRKRLKSLLSRKPRMVVRKSLNHIYAQLIEYAPDGDKVILTAHSSELTKMGWKFNTSNLPSAYLVGILLGKKAKAKGIGIAILDIGLTKSVKGSKQYAILAGAVEAGLKIPHSTDILPPKERLIGKHISTYASNLNKDNQDRYKKQFSKCLVNHAELKDITSECETIKKKIMGAQ